MVVLVQTWDLHIEGCQSLKERRAVLQPLKAALRRLNLAVAEVEHQDRWQRAGLAAAAVGGERRVAEEILREADRVIEAADGVRVIDTEMRVA